jgi:hypothetical protein
MSEPKQKPPDAIAEVGKAVCAHCGGDTFTVRLDLRGVGARIGEIVPMPKSARVFAIECAACGEEFPAVASPQR